MKRRGFLQVVAGVLLAPFIPGRKVYQPEDFTIMVGGRRMTGFQTFTFPTINRSEFFIEKIGPDGEITRIKADDFSGLSDDHQNRGPCCASEVDN